MIRITPYMVLMVLIVNFTFFLSACSEVKSEITEVEEVVSIPVIAEPVTIGSIDATYGTTASLEAAAEAAVTTRVSGIVTSIQVEEGDYVKAGQVLARLDIDKSTLELKRATANLNRIANELRRNEKLYKRNLVSSEAYERIKYQFEAQQAATDLAKLNLQYATITAPISGVISMRYIKQGNLLQQHDPAFHISDLSELYAIIHIPEAEKADLDVEQSARVYVDAAKQPFPGKILRISPIVDRDTGTVRVTVSLKDKTGVLRPGMFGRVSVIYASHNKALLIPKAAVISQDDEVSVFVIDDGLAHKRNVSIGFSDADYVEILEGIEENDLVITSGQRNLQDQTNVERIEAFANL